MKNRLQTASLHLSNVVTGFGQVALPESLVQLIENNIFIWCIQVS